MISLKNTVTVFMSEKLSQCLLTVHLKNIHTDYLTLNVIERLAQYSSQIDNNFCKVAKDKLMMHRSSAYNMWLMRLPPNEPPIKKLFNILLSSLMWILNSLGDKIPPCRTPLVTLNTFEIEHPHLTDIIGVDTNETES